MWMVEEDRLSFSGDDEVDVNGGINLKGSDVLDDRWRAVDVNDSLVDSHFVSVPGVGTLTAWRFSGGYAQNLGWHSLWSSNFVFLVFSSWDHLVAGILQVVHISPLELHSIQIRNVIAIVLPPQRVGQQNTNNKRLKGWTYLILMISS